MFFYLLLLFICVPIIEIYLLIQIGRAIDAGPTILLIVLTGLVGAALAKREGLRTMGRIQESLARGELPAKEMVEGLMIFIAGLLLVTPGVITDGVGFMVLIPPIRAWMRRRLVNHFRHRIDIVAHRTPGGGVGFGGQVEFGQRPADEEFIDVEHRDVTDEHTKKLEDGNDET